MIDNVVSKYSNNNKGSIPEMTGNNRLTSICGCLVVMINKDEIHIAQLLDLQ